MQRVLIIAENLFQQERLCSALNLEKNAHLITANLRQMSPKNLKNFQQADLIVLEDTSEQEDPRTTEYLLSSLKTTGLPIVLLPAHDRGLVTDEEPLVLNLTEASIAKPGLAALINKIREQYVVHRQASQEQAQRQRFLHPSQPPDGKMLPQNLRGASSPLSDRPYIAATDDAFADSKALFADPPQVPPRPEVSSKVVYAITAMGRISKQLREPLSNMNLAIHMLGRVQSIEERDRYVKLLREEYQRELQLVNELENLHNSLESIL